MRDLVLPVIEKLTVLTVAPDLLAKGARPDPAFLGVTTGLKARELENARQVAESDLAALQPGQTPAVCVTARGHPIQQILRVAREENADLIVMGAKGHSNLSFILLGSVSQGVVQHADRPVLIVRPGNKGVDSVLVAHDGSQAANRGLDFLQRLARPRGERVTVTQVVVPFVLPSGMPLAYRAAARAASEQINEQQLRLAERSLQVASQQLTNAGIACQTELRVDDDVDGELEDAARRYSSDVIVVGSRKPSRRRHYLLGSTAEKLVRHAPASVLVVR
jgi:nucleotide-binding universal stress UspA family protein